VRPNGHPSYRLAAPERRRCFAHGTLDAPRYMHRWQEDLGAVHSYGADRRRRRGALAPEVRDAVDTVLATLGEPPLRS
jgi:hypothetical protein